MKRYQRLFKNLSLRKEGAFIPFVTLGDPDFDSSITIIKALIQSGADALELGIPFSDPSADGPSIQKSFQRALNSKISINHCFKIINIIRKTYQIIPIGLLTYTNIVFKNGIDLFYTHCAEHAIDSILIADLPIEESKIFRHIALSHNINQIFICPPNADNYLLKKITKYSKSYIYLTSRMGVTGNEYPPSNKLDLLIKNLNKYNSPPILQGFGISTASQAKTAFLSGITGIISGSAISNIIEYNINDQTKLLNQLQDFTYSMKNAMK